MMLPMDYEQGQLSQDSCQQQSFFTNKKDGSWDFSKNGVYESNDNKTSSSSSSIGEASTISNGSLISASTISNGSLISASTDDASSSYSSINSANSSGSLYDFSDLMSQLPTKRGLSKFYQGKSRSFTSLSRAGNIEDLAKKESAYTNKRKLNKGCKGLNNNYKLYTLPKPIISKKFSRGLLSSSSFSNRKGSKFCS